MNQDKLCGGHWFDLGRQMAWHRLNKCGGTSRALSVRHAIALDFKTDQT